MTTYPNCGAPQIAKKPVKPRFEKLVLFALGADLVTIIGTFIFFNYIWMKSSSHHDPVSLALYNTLLLAMVLVTAAGPVLGLILSIVGLTRTRSKGTKGKPLNLTEAIIMGAIDGFIKGSLTLVLALAAEAIGFLLVVSIIIGVFGLCAGLIDVDCGIHLLMDKDKTNDAWGYYYIIFGSLDTAWALYGIINDSIEFGKYSKIQAESNIESNTAKITPLNPNTPNSGDAASAYPSNYNQTVISPIYTVDGFTNAVPIVA